MTPDGGPKQSSNIQETACSFNWLGAPAEEEDMQLEGIGITQPQKLGPFQLRLKFGKQAYCVVELRRGEEAAEIATKLRELAAQVEARSK